MYACTFFGHRNIYSEIDTELCEIIEDLIKNKNVTVFYVGNNGQFDNKVARILKEIKKKYTFIKAFTVLAYLPTKDKDYVLETLFPDGLEFVIPKFAIIKRNEWMIKNSQFVVTYVRTVVGGAANFKMIAENSGKTVINIYASYS